MKTIGICFIIVFTNYAFAQTYAPITITGFNIDAVAETFPNSLATTTQALDQVVAGGNSVVYSAAFAAAAGWTGGVPNSGTIVNGLKTYQMMPYTVNNALFVPAGSTNNLVFTTPASYNLISLLVFSTEGASTFNVTLNYTDLTTTNAGNYTVQDWFGGASAIISGIGRCKRVTSGATHDGVPSDPRLYGIDINLSCANQIKSIASISITGVTSNPAGGGGYVLAVSGVSTNIVAPTISYASNVFCQTAISYTPTVTGATGGIFSSTPTGLSLNTSNGIINVGAGAANTYTLFYTTSGTCPVSASYSLTINPSPTVAVSNYTICSGQTAVLTVSGAVTYAWMPDPTLTSTTGSVVNANPVNTTTYGVTGTSGWGCTATNTLTVTVNSNPSIITISYSICPGEAAVITSTPSVTGGTYQWLPDNQTTASITEAPTNATNYTVVYSVNGCTATATSSVTIKPVPNLTVNSVSICPGQSAVLTAIPSITGGTYMWAPNSQTTSFITESPSSATSYNVTYSLAGCTNTATATINFNANPVLVLTASMQTIAPLDEVSITAVGGDAYTWSTGATGSVIKVKPSENTTYCATVTTTAGCSNEACIDIIVADESVLYIPNVFTPNGDGVNDLFYTPSHNLTSYELRIYNRWGEQLFQTSDPLKGWDGSYGGKPVSSGVYVFILKATGTDNTTYNKSGHITLLQ